MRTCLESCIGQTWGAWLPLAYLALSHLNGALRVASPADRGGFARVLAVAGKALDRISLHSRHDGRGTFKLPGAASRAPGSLAD